MQKINANSGRWGYDRRFRAWEEIEAEYRKVFTDTLWPDIKGELTKLLGSADPKYHAIIDLCISDTPKWTTAKPLELSIVKKIVDDSFADWKEKAHMDFRKALKIAYGYNHDKLLFLAKMLNVKTCPYCNMHYTLYAEEYEEDQLVKEMAKFQFDHFYPQSIYPMMSVCMYNLIPSCTSCNQGKSKGDVELDFHPYHSSISDLFKFRVKDPLPLLVGKDDELLDIQLVPSGKTDIESFSQKFHIKALYSRHKDIAREVFARAYVDAYYGYRANFEFLEDQKLAERITKGFYPEKDKIEKRPMTKFQQDLWEQAKGIIKKH